MSKPQKKTNTLSKDFKKNTAMKSKKALHYKASSDLPNIGEYKTEWDFSLFYKNENDPQIEKDIATTIDSYKKFAKKWRNKDFTTNSTLLAKALKDYEILVGSASASRPGLYYSLKSELNVNDSNADKALALLRKRMRPASDEILFFTLVLGKIPKAQQKKLLNTPELKHYKYFLEQIFKGAEHDLSEAEEKIIRLKSAQSSSLWQQLTEKLIASSEITWKGKKTPLPEAIESLDSQKSSDKPKLWKIIIDKIDSFGIVTEHEFNAIITDVRTEDDLRKYKKPYSGTALAYQHDDKSIESFVETVTKKGFALSKKFYTLKAKYHGVTKLHYSQKYDSIGKAPVVGFDEALTICRDVFYKVNPLYGQTFDEMVTKGQIDVYPKKGKRGGAFMMSVTGHPINVMLNYSNTMKDIETLAHEMGHAVHASRSALNTPLYDGHTILTAETASTLFESLVYDAMYESADEETKAVLLHDKLTRDIATVQRQIAFFNTELEIHNTIHEKGAMTHQELKECMFKHLKSYLGDSIELTVEDGASYAYIPHLRYGFYVYTYAFGHLLSSVMASKFQKDNSYRKEIDTFLTAGQSASAVDIYKTIDFDITSQDIFLEALDAQRKNIAKFEKLVKNRQ